MILDADVTIDILRHRPETQTWVKHLPDRPKLSGAGDWEVLFGARNASEIRKVRTFLDLFPVAWPTEANASTVADLVSHQLSDGIDVLDSLTAAIALRTCEPIATVNIKHFRVIPGVTPI